MSQDQDHEWWRCAFGSEYLEVYAHRCDVTAGTEVDGLVVKLADAPGPILDACCGAGRHLVYLRQRGFAAFGFDFSAPLIAAAADRPSCHGAVVRADVRAPPFTAGWGAVVMLFTAFGYFDSETNRGVLSTLNGLLAPGGWIVIDMPDPARLRKKLIPESRRLTPAGYDVHEQRFFTNERVEKSVTIRRDGEIVRTYRESVQLYSQEQMCLLANQVGLEMDVCWRSLRGQSVDDGRLVFWLRKPGASS